MALSDDWDDEDQSALCPRCYGDRVVDCYCGGDLCVCDNYGERDCPTCHGEGSVSAEREATYLENQRLAHAAMKRIWEESK